MAPMPPLNSPTSCCLHICSLWAHRRTEIKKNKRSSSRGETKRKTQFYTVSRVYFCPAAAVLFVAD
jgi:hypothetical protein